jgi:hypothetical protein
MLLLLLLLRADRDDWLFTSCRGHCQPVAQVIPMLATLNSKQPPPLSCEDASGLEAVEAAYFEDATFVTIRPGILRRVSEIANSTLLTLLIPPFTMFQ